MSCEKVSSDLIVTEQLRRDETEEVLPHQRLDHIRILMYSHDTFGLGHLRRCRAVAHALVERFKGVHVLIISGSPIAGAFDFRARVDFVKIPSVIKLYNGEYTSIGQHIDLHETMAWRRSLIMETARSFHPDMFIVDKEPVGLRGELEQTLAYLKAQGCALVLGLREIMDAPNLLAAEFGFEALSLDLSFDDLSLLDLSFGGCKKVWTSWARSRWAKVGDALEQESHEPLFFG